MEALMQYVWQWRLWPTTSMVTIDGRRIEVLDPGVLNKDAGPDFFNAKVQIGGQEWVGNVEMHVRASDWHRHHHDGDPAYDNVVLHVVDVSDCEISRSNGEKIPQLVMKCARDFSQKYTEMVYNPVRDLPCAPELGKVSSLCLHDWLTALAMERVYAKTDRIFEYLKRYSGDWTQAVYVVLARALGFNTNSQPFEMLAHSTPLKHMLHYTDDLTSIEAILFGQAGLLRRPGEPECPQLPAQWGDGTIVDNSAQGGDYFGRLRTEYEFLTKKYALQPNVHIVWKMGRMRPQNFPHRRIAALSALIADNFSVGRRILSVTTEQEARALFDLDLTGYWARHYHFGAETAPTVKAFGYASVTILIINVVVPVLCAYGEATGNSRLSEHAIEMLQGLKAERNVITAMFESAGIPATDAFTSQALIQLRREYCEPRKCLYCRIGHKLLSQKVVRG